jgi:hypothetical protein
MLLHVSFVEKQDAWWLIDTKSDFVKKTTLGSLITYTQFLGYSRACGSYHGFLSANREAIDTGHRVPSG